MNIVIIGKSGLAKVVIDILEAQNQFTIAGLVDDAFDDTNEQIMGYPVLGGIDDLKLINKQHDIEGGVIAVGHNADRYNIFLKLNALLPEFHFIKAIHPSVIIGKYAEVGEGSVLMPGTIVSTNARVGRFCLLDTGSSLNHDSEMKDFSSLAPGAIVAGDCKILASCAILTGSILSRGVTIDKNTVVGAGSLVLDDIPANCVAYGLPAKVVRARKADERYL